MNRAQVLEFLKFLPIDKPLLLRSASGIGKSSLVRQYTTEVLKLEWKLPLYPAEMEPTDLVGQPYIEDGKTRFAQPERWPTGKQVLFIEEIDRCGDQMAPVIMQLIEARTAGGRKLPDDVRIIAACNGARFMSNDLDQALMRRCAVVDYKPTVKEWLEWAEFEQLDETIVAFIRANPAALDTPEQLIGKPNISIPCRATWHDCSNWLKNAKAGAAELAKTSERDPLSLNLAPFVGVEAAIDYATFVRKKNATTSEQTILLGTADAKATNLLEASHLAPKVAKAFVAATNQARKNALDFYLNVGDEAFAVLFAQLPSSLVEVVHEHERASKLLKEMIGRIKVK